MLPENFMTLPELISFLDKNMTENPVNYGLRNNFYFRDIPLSTNSVKDPQFDAYNLTLIKHRMRVPLSKDEDGIKTIINPQACIYMHHQYSWGFTPGFESRLLSQDVDPTIAASRHFRRCPFDEEKCAKVIRNATYNGAMLRFAGTLKERVEKKMATTFKYLSI
jgi:hypothetical protein